MAESSFQRVRTIAERAAGPGGAEYLRHKVPAAVGRRIGGTRRRLRDRFRSTYTEEPVSGLVARYFAPPHKWFDLRDAPGLAACAEHYAQGRFDLLGSGWADATIGAASRGFLGHRYPAEERPESEVNRANRASSEAYAGMLPGDYRRLDWQRDLRSGYRWSEALHASEIEIGCAPGADIKVPWELGKLQHLPRLALAYAAARRGVEGFADPESYRAAFRNQVVDFVAHNPPGFGVQWVTAMMGAIRGANLVVAYDLFRAAGADFETQFHALVRDAAFMHAEQVADQLEWWDFDARNNHYLSNVAGLMILAAYLPCCGEVAAWRRLAAGELVHEFDHQFLPDGTNFEGATGYHAFALDILTWGLVFAGRTPECADQPDRDALAALPRTVRRRFGTLSGPGGYHAVTRDADRHARWLAACEFLEAVTAPNGELVQIGDNDSGRFIALDVIWDAEIGREDLLDPSPVVAAARALAGECRHGFAGASAVAALTDGTPSVAPSRMDAPVPDPDDDRLVAWELRAATAGEAARSRVNLPLPRTRRWTTRCYPEFGLFLFRSSGLLLTVRCGPEELLADGGHEHDDQGSVTLWKAAGAVVRDPGTFVYTADPESRRRFRGRAVHFAPRREGAGRKAPAREAFSPLDRRPATALLWVPHGLVLEVPDEEGSVFRVIRIREGAVEVTDFVESGSPPMSLGDALARIQEQPWSAGYGRLVRPD